MSTDTRYTTSKRREVEAARAEALKLREARIAAGTFADFLDLLGYWQTPEQLAEFDADLVADYRSDYDGIVARVNA
jgi:hypothetical protein